MDSADEVRNLKATKKAKQEMKKKIRCESLIPHRRMERSIDYGHEQINVLVKKEDKLLLLNRPEANTQPSNKVKGKRSESINLPTGCEEKQGYTESNREREGSLVQGAGDAVQVRQSLCHAPYVLASARIQWPLPALYILALSHRGISECNHR